MRIAEYKQVTTNIIFENIPHPAEYDEIGELVREAWDETIEKQVPVMGTVYRDATPEEIAEFERQQAELPAPEPTTEERVDNLEATTDDIILMMADLIGGL